MAHAEVTHPSVAELTAYGLGKLPPAEIARVESHIAACDTCCAKLGQVGDDTLVQLARGAATQVRRQAELKPNRQPTPAIPPQLADHPRYEVLGLLGAGGMGAVYRARHRIMERMVALKVINQSLTASAKYVERFRREVKAAARLSHPNIVAAFDADQAGDLHFLVMECIDGLSLDRLVAKRGVLAPNEAANVIKQAAQGLKHAHDKGMLHRDIKPQNLMVTRQSQVKVLDFGLARLTTEDDASGSENQSGDESGDDGRTTAGMILGTPDYMAPEQARDATAADIRSDIYSLGCTFFYLLVGHSPVPAGSVLEKLQSHLTIDPAGFLAARGDVPAELVRIVGKMTAKQPAERYQTPGEVAQDLSAWLKNKPSELPPLPALGDSLPLLPGFDPLAANLSLPTATSRGPDAFQQLLKKHGVGIGAGLLSLAALFGLITWATSGKTNRGERGKENHVAIQPPRLVAALNNPPQQTPSVIPAKPAAAVTNRNKQVLFVLPPQFVWYEDYLPVRQRLESQGVRVLVASTTRQPCRVAPASNFRNETIQPDLRLDQANADDFATVIFGGAVVHDFIGAGSAAGATSRLIAQLMQSGKPITAICRGQGVLAGHGILEGKQAAANDEVQKNFPNQNVRWLSQPVVRDGQIITGADDKATIAFADAVLAAIGER